MAKFKIRLTEEERKARKRARYAKWCANNKERIKAHNKNLAVKRRIERQAFRLKNPLKKLTDEERRLRRNANSRKWRLVNPERAKQANISWRAANPDKVKARDFSTALRKRYGLTVAEYSLMLSAQGNCCAICKVSQPGGRGRWHVDHCAKTSTIRQLLCGSCNPGLGFFKHNTELLQRAIDYLRKFSPSQSPETSPSP